MPCWFLPLSSFSTFPSPMILFQYLKCSNLCLVNARQTKTLPWPLLFLSSPFQPVFRNCLHLASLLSYFPLTPHPHHISAYAINTSLNLLSPRAPINSLCKIPGTLFTPFISSPLNVWHYCLPSLELLSLLGWIFFLPLWLCFFLCASLPLAIFSPWCSVLGHLHFSIYTLSLSGIIYSFGLNYHLFACDSPIYNSGLDLPYELTYLRYVHT